MRLPGAGGLVAYVVLASARCGAAVPRGATRGRNWTDSQPHCQPSESCWPTPEEVDALRLALDPHLHRSLWWGGCPPLQDPALCETDEARRQFPVPASIPSFSPWNQPLYGLASYRAPGTGDQLSPVFSREQGAASCFAGPGNKEDREECFAQTRNNAMHGWEPAFTVFAMTAEHVSLRSDLLSGTTSVLWSLGQATIFSIATRVTMDCSFALL